jgi:ATP-dependent exoDNAse (exonuclease V) alpha subunit
MATFHLHVKNISRGDGRSAVAAAAYRAGAVLRNDAEERESAFGGKRDVVLAEIRLCKGAPAWMSDRARLWNSVEARERRKDARLAKEIEASLPRELTFPEKTKVVQAFADMYTSAGHVVDVAIHDDGSGHNPHMHMLLTLRAVEGEGFGPKLMEANALSFVTTARARWAELVNAALGKAGAGVQVDHRSLAQQGVERAPTAHRGPNRAERLLRRRRNDPDRARHLERTPVDPPQPRASEPADWLSREIAIGRAQLTEEVPRPAQWGREREI